jgi:hypothetical protein
VDVRLNFGDKQEMMLMLVPLVVAMWDARSGRPGAHVKSASKARDGPCMPVTFPH